MRKILYSFILIFLLQFLILTKVYSASNFTKIESNPVLSPGPESWDNLYVHAPSVLYVNGQYKMWFAGHNDSVWQVGLATSSDGISWVKYEGNPVLASNPNDPMDRVVHTPRVIYDSGTYKMWYTASPDDSSNFTIRWATSSDGINWIRQGVINLPSSPWDAGGRVYPFVLKVGSSYKMWYTANDGSGWKIGLATSPDGINWTAYQNNPVLWATESWEGGDADGSSVLFNGTTYEIYYHGSTNISYATSTDGIHWTKPADKNPALGPTSGTFDSGRVAGAGAIRLENGTTLLYYGGYGYTESGFAWRIGLATDNPFPNPSPSPAPSPTPTPGPVTKVVVVPGFGASWNSDAIINCKLSGYSGDWVQAPYAADVYNPLLTELSNRSVSPLPFYYDWRQKATNASASLKTYINKNLADGERLDLVGHSFGGLVSRSYVEQETTNNRLSKLMTVGAPHQGVVASYLPWSGGEVSADNIVLKIAGTLILKRCHSSRQTDRETIRVNMPSIQNILPTFDYLRDIKTGLLKPVSGMDAQNNWLPTSGFSPPFYGITVGTLSGTGQNTLNVLKVKEATKKNKQLGNWVDGEPTASETTKDGDGTVLLTSSQVNGAENWQITQSHSGIISSTTGVNQILDFLGFPAPAKGNSFNSPQTSSALLIIGYPSSFRVTDPHGKTTKDSDQLVSILNPESGTYKLILLPKSRKTLVIVGQFLSDGQIFWKEYNFNTLFPIPLTKSIIFNTLSPQEDALR